MTQTALFLPHATVASLPVSAVVDWLQKNPVATVYCQTTVISEALQDKLVSRAIAPIVEVIGEGPFKSRNTLSPYAMARSVADAYWQTVLHPQYRWVPAWVKAMLRQAFLLQTTVRLTAQWVRPWATVQARLREASTTDALDKTLWVWADGFGDARLLTLLLDELGEPVFASIKPVIV